MKNRRFYKIGLVLSVAAFICALFIPESMGATSALVGWLGIFCFVIFLIALIVSGIRARKKPVPAQETPLDTSVPVETAPTPVQPIQPAQPVQPVQPMQPVEPAPPVQPSQPKPQAKKAVKIERVHVRGVNHNTKNIIAVAMENPDYSLSKRELQEDFLDERVWQYQFFVKAALVPEPDNEYDPNAIMVQADGLCIGHVPAGSTAHIRKLMESGRIKYMDLQIGGGKYKEVCEVDDDEYELERGELKYSAVLELHLTEEDIEA